MCRATAASAWRDEQYTRSRNSAELLAESGDDSGRRSNEVRSFLVSALPAREFEFHIMIFERMLEAWGRRFLRSLRAVGEVQMSLFPDDYLFRSVGC